MDPVSHDTSNYVTKQEFYYGIAATMIILALSFYGVKLNSFMALFPLIIAFFCLVYARKET